MGKDAFVEQIDKESLPLTDYLLDHLAADIDMSRLDGRARLAQLARPLLNSMPSGTLKALLIGQLAKNTGLSHEQLDDILATDKEKTAPAPAPTIQTSAKRSPHVTRALELLLHQPGLATDAEYLDRLQILELPGMDTLCQIISVIVIAPNIASSAIIERFRDTPYYDRLCELAGNAGVHDDNENEKEFRAVIGRLKLMAINQETGKLAARSSTLSQNEKEKLRELYQDKRALEQELETS